MANNNNNNNNFANLILFLLLLLVLFSASANAVTVTVNVTGELCCTPDLACPGAPLDGAVVVLNLINDSVNINTTVADTVTAADGTFIMERSLTSPLFKPFMSSLPTGADQIPLTVSVQPPTNCSLLSGTYTRGITLTGAAIADEIGYIYDFTIDLNIDG